MSFDMPIIILLLAANALWFFVGWALGYKEALEDQDFRVAEDAR